MRKCFFGVCAFVLVSLVALSAPFGTGAGKVVSASVVPTVVSSVAANTVSIYNSGSVIVWAMVNTTGAACSNAAVAGTAVPIAPSTSYMFDMREKGQIDTVVVMTTNSTATAYLAFF